MSNRRSSTSYRRKSSSKRRSSAHQIGVQIRAERELERPKAATHLNGYQVILNKSLVYQEKH